MRASDRANDRDTDAARRTSTRATRPAGDRAPSLAALQRSVGNATVLRMLQRAASLGAPASGRRSSVHDVLRTPGRPLNSATRADMQARLGADFSDVRVHTGDAARRSAAEIGARAYTSGSHVVIGDGGADRHTLAHELTHVIQQRSGPVAGVDNGAGLSVSDPSDRYEREAEATATKVMAAPVAQRAATPTTRSGASPTTWQGAQAPVQRVEGAPRFTMAKGEDDVFMAHVDVSLISGADSGVSVPARDVRVDNVTISDTDRGPTRFGKDQKAHTTAWTLIRKALTNLAGKPAQTMLDYVEHHLTLVETTSPVGHVTTIEQSRWAARGEKRWRERSKATRRHLDELKSATDVSLADWAHALSDLLEGFVSAYQSSPAATRDTNDPAGRDEARTMGSLQSLEDELRGEPEDYTLTDQQRGRVEQHMTGLKDIGLSKGAKHRTDVEAHFGEFFGLAFPRIDRALGNAQDDQEQQLTEAFRDLNVSAPDAIMGELPLGALRTGFLVRVHVGNDTSDQPVINRIETSRKERPKTQFNKEQRSHTAAWGLIQRRVKAMEGTTPLDGVALIGRLLDESAGLAPEGTSLERDWLHLFDHLREQVDTIKANPPDYEPHQWSTVVSTLARGCLILRNADRLATTGGPASALGQALGDGEPAVYAKLKELNTLGEENIDEDQAARYAVRLIDTAALRTRIIHQLPPSNTGKTRRTKKDLDADKCRGDYNTTLHEDADVRRIVDRWIDLILVTYPDIGLTQETLSKAAYKKMEVTRDGENKFSKEELDLLS